MTRPFVSLVAAVARHGGIGKDNALLLRLPEDLAHFKQETLGGPVVMGRRTWESIGRALPGRRNVVVTRNPDYTAAGAETVPSWESALQRLAQAERICVIGGADLYAAALPRADELVLTEIDAAPPADTFFPHWDRGAYEEVERASHRSVDGIGYAFVRYRRRGAPADRVGG